MFQSHTGERVNKFIIYLDNKDTSLTLSRRVTHCVVRDLSCYIYHYAGRVQRTPEDFVSDS